MIRWLSLVLFAALALALIAGATAWLFGPFVVAALGVGVGLSHHGIHR